MSNIMKELSRANSSRSLRIDNFASYNSTCNLASSSYKLNRFANTKESLATSYSQHDKILKSSSHPKKYYNSKINIEISQLENQLKDLSNLSNYVPKNRIFEEEYESILFPHPNNPPLNINVIRRRYIKKKLFVPDVEWIN